MQRSSAIADLDIALDVAFRITYSTLARQVMYGPLFESDIDLAWDQLTAELAIACAAYLLRLGPRARGRDLAPWWGWSAGLWLTAGWRLTRL